ncbi:MAG: radical SAM protein, partial [bacterium]
GEGLGDVSGLSFRVGNNTFHNPEVPPCHNLDEIPFPDFSLIRSPKGTIRPIMTSRGCPYDCSFCTVTKMFGRRYRFRSKENVMRELRTVDPKEVVFFYDDHFAANKERTKDLLRMMIDEGITPRWTAQVRADVTKDRELMELFQKSNCLYVYVGIESVNPETLVNYNKKISVQDIEDSIAVFHEYGVRVHGMFVMGSDEDTVESIRSTTHFAKKNKIDTVQFMILTPIPGADQFKQVQEENRILTKDWGLYDGHHVVFQPKRMSAFELQVEAVKAQSKFYSMGQIMKSISKFDLLGVLLRAYGRRLQKKWASGNKYYYDIIKQMTTDAADRVNLTWSRTRDEIARLTQGFKEKGQKSQSEGRNYNK